MDYLEHNLRALAQEQPDLARTLARTTPPEQARLETGRKGLPCLLLGKSRLCSSVDPVDEGRRLAATAGSGPLVVFGFGLGYHLDFLLDRELVVYEPDPGLLRLALEARDLSRVLARARLVLDPEGLSGLEGRALLVHPPSARLHPVELQGLKRRLQQPARRPSRPARPRVLVIPPLFGGSLPVAHWCAQALAQLGCRVSIPPLESCFPLYDLVRQKERTWPEDRLDRVRAPMVSFLSELALLEAEAQRPHLCLVLAQAPLNRRAVEGISRLGAVTAFWFIENYRHMGYYRELAAGYDHFFHIQGPALEAELDRLGANHAFLPMAAHPPCHRPLELDEEDRWRYGAPVGFMGAGYPNRFRFFTELVRAGLDFRIWGTGWPKEGSLAQRVALGGRRLESREVTKVYNACSVVLNLHASPDPGQPVGGSDFVNPRTFEVPACGGFQLVDRVEGLERFFRLGRELAVFGSRRELVELVHHYLEHPELRLSLAAAGRRRVLAQHTYYHRMESLLSRCLGPAAEDQDLVPSQDPATRAALNLLQALAGPGAGEETPPPRRAAG